MQNKIAMRIDESPCGTIFVTSDFSDIASSKTANRALLRLEEKGIIRRVLRGVYEKPEYSDFLQEYVAPSPDKVARAIARNNGWRIVPNGDTALNTLGLSTQVPSTWLYVSDGPYKEYPYGEVTLSFKRTAKREFANLSDKTALVIQALKALGEKGVTETVLCTLASLLTSEEKEQMIQEAKYATDWIYQNIRKISECESDR